MRTSGRERCDRASPGRCNSCFPETPADRFLLRERFIKTLFGQIDRFIAPSQFIKDRFVAWGLAADTIDVIANGRPFVEPAPHSPSADGRRPVFGYFGNLNPWKGVPNLLKAAQRLIQGGMEDFELRLHGGAPFQSKDFVDEIETLLDGAELQVVRIGQYRRDELPALIAAVDWVVMPSIWWENAPLVIQEAFLHRRPVITSSIGGMAEAVRDGVNGLHVRPDDPVSLASTMRTAMETPGLWDSLVAGITPPPDIAAVAERHLTAYRGIRQTAEIIELKVNAA
jgi:glycosyltransferase involved in cell wall biosynthesis